MQLMAALLVLLLLLAVPPTAFTANVYYVTADDAGHEQSCPPHQICHKLSYYIISQPDSYFTNGTTIIFLEGQHSFDSTDLVHVSNVHNLTLKGQGQWPVAGPEETVMQSTVIITCTRGRGGFIFTTSNNITVEGLTVVNCGNKASAVFNFGMVANLLFYKNSIQHMTGCGLLVHNCQNVTITNCSYFHSVKCYPSKCGGVGIVYKGSTQYSNAGYSLKLSHSNMTKCCSYGGGGIYLEALRGFGSANLLFSHLVLLYNKAAYGGGMQMKLAGTRDQIDVNISNCKFSHGSASQSCGGLHSSVGTNVTSITIQNTDFVENFGHFTGEIAVLCPSSQHHTSLSMLNSTIQHTRNQHYCLDGVTIYGYFSHVKLVSTKMTFANLHSRGFVISCSKQNMCMLQMNNCQFERSINVLSVLYLFQTVVNIFTSCTFSNNTGGESVITISQSKCTHSYNSFINCTISDNSMTGITLFETVAYFTGRNVIQNNRNTEGAGIILALPSLINVDGELLLYNNTADEHGGAILVKQPVLPLSHYGNPTCTLHIIDNSTSVTFSGNRARKGGSDIYGAILMGCDKPTNNWKHESYIPHIGQSNETSWYFYTPFIKYFHFSNTDRLSSMSSDPIMVCFCNNSNLPDCSDRTPHHVQTYPGQEINTSIATVGYYGGISPSVLLVSAQHATLVRYYGQNEITNCFQLHILLQNTSSTTALVDIKVEGGLQDWGLSIGVDITECPIGFTQVSGHCHCEQFLANSNVQCNVSVIPFKFLRLGNSWFAYINNTQQCVTGTSNCPFDYCNRSNVSFDIMAPDRQCVANRAGILCGQCQSHLSIMLGPNRCDTCSNWYLFLLPVFVLAGIVLVAVLMFLNLSVSVGECEAGNNWLSHFGHSIELVLHVEH